LRIEMVVPTLDAAGMEVMVANLTRGLAERGHDVGVTCLEADGPLADELRAAGSRVAVVVSSPGFRGVLRPVELEAWLREVRPDIVHVHSGGWLKAARAAHRAGVRHVVHTVHGLLDHEPWHGVLLKRWAARYTESVVAVSEPLRQYLLRVVRLPATKVTLVPNGVDEHLFSPGPRHGDWRGAMGIPPGALVIGNVARLDSVKNHADLIDAFAMMRPQVPEAVLVIAGEGPLRRDLEARVAALGATQQIRFLGETRDIARIYREFDLFVLSSRAEGTSLSVLEAMASGVCVVATAVGGTPALLRDGAVGCLVRPGDPRGLATAMADLMHDQRRRRELADAGRNAVIARYSLETMVRRYEQEYRRMAGAAPAPASQLAGLPS
jgi:glycosyltransferase involved in cell wall biosynthesis